MKIALLGYGRMGKEVETQAKARGHEITAIFDIDDHFSATSPLNGAEAIISFVLPDAAVDNIKTATQLGLPIVEGTTGWYEALDSLKTLDGLTLVYSPNFSIGVYQFTKIVEYAARLMGQLPEYDCYVHEWHHTGKADSPSGTAGKLAKVLLNHLPTKTHLLTETSHSQIPDDALHVTSTRVGRVSGTHEIGFDSAADEIVLKHVAHGREGFALGAVRAAEWIVGKRGIFTMDDFMNDLLTTQTG